jgi:hypothetical protein
VKIMMIQKDMTIIKMDGIYTTSQHLPQYTMVSISNPRPYKVDAQENGICESHSDQHQSGNHPIDLIFTHKMNMKTEQQSLPFRLPSSPINAYEQMPFNCKSLIHCNSVVSKYET